MLWADNVYPYLGFLKCWDIFINIIRYAIERELKSEHSSVIFQIYIAHLAPRKCHITILIILPTMPRPWCRILTWAMYWLLCYPHKMPEADYLQRKKSVVSWQFGRSEVQIALGPLVRKCGLIHLIVDWSEESQRDWVGPGPRFYNISVKTTDPAPVRNTSSQ